MGGGLIKGRWRRNGEEKEKEGRGLYCNGPGYKTAGYKAGKTARAGPRSEVRDPATFFLGISRAGWPKWSSNARFARLLSPNEAALAPSFVAVLRSYARPSSSRIDSRERATNSLEFRYSLFFFFFIATNQAPPRSSAPSFLHESLANFSYSFREGVGFRSSYDKIISFFFFLSTLD